MSDIKAECLSYMIAASDTTAGLVCPLIECTIRESRIYQTVLDVIDRLEKQGKLSAPVASFEETNEMSYFSACVKESLRLFPSTPIILPRYVPHGGLYLNGTCVPEGVEIGANPRLINRNEDVFGEDAHIFRPERWLETSESTRRMKKSSFTSGYGARECMGKQPCKAGGPEIMPTRN